MKHKQIYETPTMECVELKISNAMLQGSPMEDQAYRKNYGAADEWYWK